MSIFSAFDRGKWLPLLLLGGLLTGLYGVLSLRLSVGDSFPAYSSYRTDLAGTAALYESLASIPGIRVERSFRPLRDLEPHPGSTLLLLGFSNPGQEPEEVAALEDFAEAGGRLVVTLPSRALPGADKGEEDELEDEKGGSPASAGGADPTPNAQQGKDKKETKRDEAKPSGEEAVSDGGQRQGGSADTDRVGPSPAGDAKEKAPTTDQAPANDPAGTSRSARARPEGTPPPDGTEAKELWDILNAIFGSRCALPALERWEASCMPDKELIPTGALLAAREETEPGLEAGLPWWGRFTLTPRNPAWEVLYRLNGQPVAMERPLGKGQLVVVADSYFVSNEALKYERRTRFLSRVLGRNPHFLFDESHVGVVDQTGVAGLARRYGLGGLVTGLLGLGLLFIWRFGLAFPPVSRGEAEGQLTRGREAREGLVALLQRSVAAEQLLETCLEVYERGQGKGSQEARRRLETARRYLAERGKTGGASGLVSGYRALGRILRPPRS